MSLPSRTTFTCMHHTHYTHPHTSTCCGGPCHHVLPSLTLGDQPLLHSRDTNITTYAHTTDILTIPTSQPHHTYMFTIYLNSPSQRPHNHCIHTVFIASLIHDSLFNPHPSNIRTSVAHDNHLPTHMATIIHCIGTYYALHATFRITRFLTPYSSFRWYTSPASVSTFSEFKNVYMDT